MTTVMLISLHVVPTEKELLELNWLFEEWPLSFRVLVTFNSKIHE